MVSVLQGCLSCHFLFCVIASFCREKGHYFFNFSVLLKFFRIRSWKRNFSWQDPTPHLERTVEAGSTGWPGRAAPSGQGGHGEEVRPLRVAVLQSTFFSHFSPAGPSTTDHSAAGRNLTVLGLVDLPREQIWHYLINC